MHFTIPREEILKPLQITSGVVERRKTFPILANILFRIHNQQLTLIATDSEVELTSKVNLINPCEEGKVTIPGRKLMDICRSLKDDAVIKISLVKDRVQINSGSSKFSLVTLPADDFPCFEEEVGQLEFSIKQSELRYLIEKTHFAMAQQDVRYFLNGLLIEASSGKLNAVATDGHRMSFCELALPSLAPAKLSQVIVPRKGILELYRLLEENDEMITVSISEHHIRVVTENIIFTSKLVDGRFPDYNSALPKQCDKIVVTDREQLKDILTRTAILSNEKFRGVCMQLRQGLLKVFAHNPEQEEAEDQLKIAYTGGDLDIGFNVNYLLDVLNTMGTETVELSFSDANSSLLMSEGPDSKARYVIMPMRL